MTTSGIRENVRAFRKPIMTRRKNRWSAVPYLSVEKNPDIGAIMLECTGMQPFARAVQREVELPVFSWGTLLDYAYSVVNHRDYYGHV